MTDAPVSTLLLQGVAQLLDTAGVARYRPDGDYTDGEIPVTFAELAPTGRAVALSLYGEETVDRSSTRYLIQARIRETDDPLEQTLTDGVRTVLAWRRHPPMPDGVDVVQITPISRAALGRIAGAYQHSRNFSLLT